MSLTGRFSALFLAALGLSLIVFSTALYVSARVYLAHRVHERLDATLAILAAAAEIHPDDVEWEPTERVLMPGQESGPDRLRWIVLDERGRPIDRSPNLAGMDDLAEELARQDPGGSERSRLVDRQGGTWRVSRRVLRPGGTLASGSAAGQGGEPAAPDRPDALHPWLVLVAWRRSGRWMRRSPRWAGCWPP